MRVVIAEKPSQGAAIAVALGLKNKGTGFIEGTDPNGKPTIVTWAIGHLVEAVNPEAYNESWKTWSWGTLPMIPEEWKYDVIAKTRDQFKVIKAQLAKATEIVIATDAGREGELIASLIINKAGVMKVPSLRLWASSLTEAAILEAYRAMKPWSAYKGMTDAAYGRSKADWLVGMSGTRGMTLHARAHGHTEKGSWRVGRVVTPTLAILVERELEIRNFVSKDYFVLEAVFEHTTAGTYSGKWFRGEKDRFDQPEKALALLASLKGRPAKIAKFETKEVRKEPEQFYDLTSLQKEANKRFHFTSEKTLKVAQELYERKVLSYPRTGSRHLTEADAVKIPNWLETLKNLPAYAPFVAEITSTKLSKRFISDEDVEDHSALVPTENTPNWEALSGDEQKIYDLVARRFMAAFFPPRIEAKTILITEIQGSEGPEAFKTTGTAVIDPGWSRVDTPAQGRAKKRGKKGAEEEDEDSEKPLELRGAALKVGDPAKVKDLKSLAKKTNPPKRMTEADLLGAMQSAGKDLDEEELRAAMRECSGIGTPATRGATIEKLLDAGTATKPQTPLVVREKNFLIPTPKGMDLISMLPFQVLRSAEMTGRWETQLEAIAKGKETLPAFLKKIEEYTHDMVNALRGTQGASGDAISNPCSPAPSRLEAKKLDEPCPRCGQSIYLRSWEGRFYIKCEKKGCFYGYDTDSSGKATTQCIHCGGKVNTNSKGQICCDCGRWQNERSSTGAASEDGIRREDRSAPERLGTCPKCEKGTLRIRKGDNGYFVACSDRDGCGLIYGSDEAGEPEGGRCKFCKTGPVRKTRNGSAICVCCDRWQDDKPAAGKPGETKGKPAGIGSKPPSAKCPRCKEAMKTLLVKGTTWKYRCDPCNAWHDVGKA